MSALVFLGAGAAVLMLVLVLAARRRDDESAEAPGLPSRAVMDRILAVDDAAFIASLHDRRIQRVFLSERRRLALAWVRQMRREAGRLRRTHVQGVRETGDLRPVMEVRIAGEFALFVLLCAILMMLVRLWGPFRTRATVRLLHMGVGALAVLGNRITVGAGMPAEASAS